MKKTYIICLSLIILSSAWQQAFAGWPIGKYRSIVIPSFNYYTSKDSWDRNGTKVKGADGSGFTSYAIGLYFGYGLTRRMDLLVNVLAPYQSSKLVTATGAVTPQNSSGLGDMQVGVSYALINFGYKSYLSIQASGIIPLYKNTNRAIALGYGAYGGEVKLMYAGGIDSKLFKGYYNLEAGYRRFFDFDGPNVLVYSASVGVPVPGRNQVSVEVGGQWASSNNKTFSQNLSVNRDFAFTKAGLNFGHAFTRRFSLFANGFYTFTGRNSGIGYGGSLQAIMKI
ncbi:hypothetical protein [Mucilaginibacter sp.]|jgi:hypothetical protein|uniref:hypothetical protein n=1 Tax=Mucilaginibacter sp. TaxID=1882438 RepID=UPI003569CD80